LLIMAISLSQRVNLAWGVTILLLIVGAGFTAAQNDRMWVCAILVVSALLLAPFRSSFYRHARLLSGPLEGTNALSLIALVICLLALAVTRSHTHPLSDNSWWAVVLSPEMPHSMRAAVAVSVLLALIAIWLLLRPGRVHALPWNAATRQRFHAMGGTVPPVEPDGVVMGEGDRAGIVFRRVGRVVLGLGDPVGTRSDRISAIWRLRDFAQQEGLDPAIWRAGRDFLPVYGNLGLTALPLGPDGLHLPEAPDDTPPSDHYLVCIGERDLTTLLPLLPELAGAATVSAAA
jgi:lysylphosphatidylglycerol synthetase-like protein (DUF2156 family)